MTQYDYNAATIVIPQKIFVSLDYINYKGNMQS